MNTYTSRYNSDYRFSSDDLAEVCMKIQTTWRRPWSDVSSKLVMMPVDPTFMHIYWTVSANDIQANGVNPSEHHGKYALDLCPVENGKPMPERAFTMLVQGTRGDRRVWLPPGNRTYQAALKLETPLGEQRILANSEVATLPAPAVPLAILLDSVGTPCEGLRPEPTLMDEAHRQFPQMSQQVLDASLNGLPVLRLESAQHGIYYDENLIDQIIEGKLTTRLPDLNTNHLLRYGTIHVTEGGVGGNASEGISPSGAGIQEYAEDYVLNIYVEGLSITIPSAVS